MAMARHPGAGTPTKVLLKKTQWGMWAMKTADDRQHHFPPWKELRWHRQEEHDACEIWLFSEQMQINPGKPGSLH